MRHRKAIAAAALVAGVSTVLIATSGVGATNEMTAPVKVTVTMTDFKFKLSRTTVPKNTQVIFTVVNKGPSPHDFDVATTKGTPVIQVGSRTTQKVTFKRAAKLRFVCTVPRHAAFGMTGNLTVK